MECQICFEHFDLNSFVPKVLTKCGHSFCKICLERLLFQKNHITCPVCRDNTKVTKKEALPTNYSLIEIIDSNSHNQKTKSVLEKYKYFNNKNYKHINEVIIRHTEPKKLVLKKIHNDDYIYLEEFENNQNISLFSNNLTKRNRRYCFNPHSYFAYLFNEYSFSISMYRKSSKCKHSKSCLEWVLGKVFWNACIALLVKYPLAWLLRSYFKDVDMAKRYTIYGQVGLWALLSIGGMFNCAIAYYIDEILKFK
jgi:hypothetical protein